MSEKQLAPWVQAMKQAEPRFKEINSKVGAVDWAIEASYARQLIQNNKYLAECPPQTIRDAIVNIAAVGLSLNPAEKLAYLVPRDGKCVLDISYQGLLKIATDTGSILWARAELVYDGDEFAYKGPAQLPEHTADVFASNRGTDEGFRGAYCIAKTKEGDYLVSTMSAEEIFKVRACSKAFTRPQNKGGPSGPWVSFFGEMAKKTVIKRAQKTWPRTDKTERLDQAIHVLNEHEGLSYTDEQLRYYVQHVEKEHDPVEFVVFIRGLDNRTHFDLYNHWEYGQKVKMKKKADDLSAKGWEMIHDYASQIREAVDKDDDGAVHEIMNDLSPGAQELVMHNSEPRVVDYCKHIGYEEAA